MTLVRDPKQLSLGIFGRRHHIGGIIKDSIKIQYMAAGGGGDLQKWNRFQLVRKRRLPRKHLKPAHCDRVTCNPPLFERIYEKKHEIGKATSIGYYMQYDYCLSPRPIKSMVGNLSNIY